MNFGGVVPLIVAVGNNSTRFRQPRSGGAENITG